MKQEPVPVFQINMRQLKSNLYVEAVQVVTSRQALLQSKMAECLLGEITHKLLEHTIYYII